MWLPVVMLALGLEEPLGPVRLALGLGTPLGPATRAVLALGLEKRPGLVMPGGARRGHHLRNP